MLIYLTPTVWWTAAAIVVVSGVALTVYEVLVQSFRQAVVPDELMGRVLAAFRLIGLGVIPLGGVLGGLVGRAAGVHAPFLVAAVFCKTCATILDEAGLSARAIADQLGHARPSMTQDVYMARKVLNPATAAALEAAARPAEEVTADA